jgi:ABC-type multidrug transport system fused ATPase/permease subunit
MAEIVTTEPARRVGFRTLLPYLRVHVSALVVVASLSLVAAAGTLAQPLMIRLLLDRIESAVPVGSLVFVLIGLLLGIALINGLRNFLLQRTAEGLVLNTRRRLSWHLLQLPIMEYDRRRTGDLLSRVGADTTLLRAVVTSGLLELVSGVIIVIGAAAMMLLIDPLMFTVTVAALSGLVGGILIARRVRNASEQAQARIGEMTAAVERAISAARTIRAARAERREADTVAKSAEEAYHAGVRMAKLQAMVGPAVTTAIQGGFLAVLGIGGARVASGAMSVGDLVAFVLFLFLLMMPIGQAMNAYTQLQAGLGALQRIEDVLGLPTETAGDISQPDPDPEPGRAPGPTPGPTSVPAQVSEPGLQRPAIEFDQVNFSYPDGEPVLHDISFAVPPGTRTALVGPSGAGKSTALALVERFYEATSGTIRINGVDIRELSRSALREQLGYVEQEAPVLAGTIRDNLLLGCPSATDDQLIAALDEVNLTELLRRTSDGLNAEVGESGVLLSGGERQRLAIARTLLAGAPILLLDEPTSNLDARNEHALRQAINTAATKRTLLVVAHRLSTVVDSDQIIVFDHGRVAAVGRHHELADTNSLYRELAAHQLLVE